MLLVPVLYLLPMLSLVLGTVFRESSSRWPTQLLWMPLLGVIALGTAWCIRFRGLRLMFISHTLLALWFEVCAWAVAGMAVNGEWS